MTGATAQVTIRLGDRSIEQLHAMLAGWDADVEISSRAPTVREVLAYVAMRHDVTVEQLCGPSRLRRLSDLRAAVSWLAHRHLGRSFPQIGRAMGDRDHSTIFAQVARATSARVAEPAFAAVLDDLLDHFGYGEQA